MLNDHYCEDLDCVMCYAYNERMSQIMFYNVIESVEADYSWDDTHSFIAKL